MAGISGGPALQVADLPGRAHDHDRRLSGVEPAQEAIQVAQRNGHAANRGFAEVGVDEDARARVGHYRVGVVVDYGEAGICDRFGPESFAVAAEWWLLAAGYMLEGVVPARRGVLVPPVTADKAVVGLLGTGVGSVAIYDRSDTENTNRCGAVALPVVVGKAVAPDQRRP